MNLAINLEKTAARLPEKIAIRFAGASVTYRELDATCNQLANGLKSLGLKAGDRCLVMLPNSLEIVFAYYALAKLGAIAVPVNFLFRQHELSYILADSRPKAIIAAADYLEELSKVLEVGTEPEILLVSGKPADDRFRKLEEVYADSDTFTSHSAEADETLAIIYTSGTTGVPKGVMLTQDNLTSMPRISSELRGTLEPDTVVLGVLPLFQIYGFNRVLNTFVATFSPL